MYHTSPFGRFAKLASRAMGHPWAFIVAILAIVVWLATGPLFGFSDTWQLVINTGTTIVTFLMVFLIQNTQNRDIMAVQLKLSELVLAMKGAENKFASIEDMSDEELEQLHNECRDRAQMTLDHLEARQDKKEDKKQDRKAAGKTRKKTAAHAARAATRKSPRKSVPPKR